MPGRAAPQRVGEILSDLYALLGRIQSSPEAQRKSVYAACIHSLSELIQLMGHPLPTRELLDLIREADRDLRSLAGLDRHARSESQCQQRARASMDELSSRLAQHGVQVPLRPGSELQEVGSR